MLKLRNSTAEREREREGKRDGVFSDACIMHAELPGSRYSHSAAVAASFCCLGQRSHIDMSLKTGTRVFGRRKHTRADARHHLVLEIN